ncbi:MAG: hypothetical protein AMXMBFR84_02900 [Candidatus Hydrogenedentota bacterium]
MILDRLFKKRQRLSGSPMRSTQAGPPVHSGERRLMWVIILGAFAVLVVAVTPRLSPVREKRDYNLDSPVAQQDFIAEFPFESENLEETRIARESAEAKVPDIYRVDRNVVQAQLERLDQKIEALKSQREPLMKSITRALDNKADDQSAEAVIADAVRQSAQKTIETNPLFDNISDVELLSLWLTPALASVTPQSEPAADGQDISPAPDLQFAYAQHLASLARTGLRYVLTYGVLTPESQAAQYKISPERQIRIVRDTTIDSQFRQEEMAVMDALTTAKAADALRQRIVEETQKLTTTASVAQPADWTKLQDAAFLIAAGELTATLDKDEEETMWAKETARRDVDAIMHRFEVGEYIQARGRRWTPQSKLDVQTFLTEKAAREEGGANLVNILAANMILVGLIIASLLRMTPLVSAKPEQIMRNLNLSLVIMCATLLTGRVVIYFNPDGLLVPLAAGGILLAILTNPRLASLVTVATAMLLSLQFDYSWRVLVVNGVMAFAGVISITRVRRRGDMARAAFIATAVGMLAMAAVILGREPLFTMRSLQLMGQVVLNGMACVFIVPGLLPPLEKLFGITTDIQLLEYSDLNNPILRRLAMEIPATHAHSLMLGQLAESACEAIGANGLLARVCAYYHDIGKLRRPEYFTENQTGVNIHEDLSPRLSARAIASHVTEGAEMARELHLPKPIIDAIYEHHGTCLISFFYQEAKKQAKHGEVSERDFRYGGPKPQSRETAIMMICDAVESGVRSLKSPNEERIREFIDKIITNRATDRQFDECDLRLKDLDTIAEVLSKHMSSTMHRRIAYPGQPQENKLANVIPMQGGQES